MDQLPKVSRAKPGGLAKGRLAQRRMSPDLAPGVAKAKRGRPPLPDGERRRNVGIMLEPAVIAMLDDLARWSGESKNDAVNEAVRRYHRIVARKL